MIIAKILADDLELVKFDELFCKNQKSFYLYIAHYAAANCDNGNEGNTKPLRLHKVENMVDCIFSPNIHWSFYNVLLDTDICSTMKQCNRNDTDRIIKTILSLAANYKCPIRLQVTSTAFDTQKLLKRHLFIELPQAADGLQYIDFYRNNYVLQCHETISDVTIYELDDSTQVDCQLRKFQWGYVLSDSFGFPKPEIHGAFYANVWSRVEVGPTKPIRMFIAIKNDRVVGGCQVSLACGIASLFNVITLKSERGKGIGKALSQIAMRSVQEMNYRYIVLAASAMGSSVYKKLGFVPIPSHKAFIKISTAAWYYKIIEFLLVVFGIQRLQRFIKFIRKPSKYLPIIIIIIMAIICMYVASFLQ